MYFCILLSDMCPCVDTKYERVHSVGSLLFNSENSCLSILELNPLICPIRRLGDSCGFATMNKCTWSDITSSANILHPNSFDFSLINSFNLVSILPVRTARRYFGHHTKW